MPIGYAPHPPKLSYGSLTLPISGPQQSIWGRHFFFTYPARSHLIVIYLVLTCPVFDFIIFLSVIARVPTPTEALGPSSPSVEAF